MPACSSATFPPSALQASPAALLRLDTSEAWFGGDPGDHGGTGSGLFPLADLFKDPAGAPLLNL